MNTPSMTRSERERYWDLRRAFAELDGDALDDLADTIADDPGDPRGDDAVHVHALSMARKMDLRSTLPEWRN